MVPQAARDRAMGLLLLGCLLRLQGLGWDAWQGFHPDESALVLAAGALGPFGTFPGPGGLDSPGGLGGPGSLGGLGPLLPRLALFCQARPDPTALLVAARVISACLSAAALPLAYAIAARLAGQGAALWALALVALSAPLIQWGHFGTVESGLILGPLLLWHLGLRFLSGQAGLWRTAALSGIVLGLTLGLSSFSALAVTLPLTALVQSRALTRRATLPALLAMLALAVALFAVTTPSALLAPAAFRAELAAQADILSGRADPFWTWSFHRLPRGWTEAAQLWRMLDGTAAPLALAGLAYLIGQRQGGAAPALVFALLTVTIVATWQVRFARALAPVLPVALILAGIGIDAALTAARRLPHRTTLTTALWLGVALPLITGLAMAASFRATDPRLQMQQDLTARAQPGTRILTEPGDILPALPPGTQGWTLPLHDQRPAALPQMLAQGDWMVLASRRNWAVLPGLSRLPWACGYYAALASGDLGWRVVARFRRAGPLGPILDPDLGAEETRSVFDRPEPLLLQNVDHLTEAELARRIAQPGRDCRPVTLAAAFAKAR